MNKQTLQLIKNSLAGLVALLLIAAPSAHAAKTRKKAKKISPKSHSLTAETADQLIERGLADMEKKKYDTAIENFSRATRLDAKSSAAFFLLGYAHYQRGFRAGPENADRTDAMKTISAYSTALSLDPELTAVAAPYRLYHSLALSYEAVESYDKAIDSYKKAFQAAPGNPLLPLYAARLRYRLDDMEKSSSNLALSLKVAHANNKDKALLKLLKTNAYFSTMLKSPENLKVVAKYDRSVMTLASSDISVEADMRDSVSDAQPDERRQIIAEKPQDPAVMKQLGVADDEFQYGRYREAIDSYNETLRLNQKVGTLNAAQLSLAYERMGTSYRQLGLSNGAIKSLQYSVQQMPFNSSAHYQLAMAYSVSGKFTNSLRALSEALKNAPTSGELRKLMLLAKTDSELDPLRDMPGFQNVMAPYLERFNLQATR